MDEIDRAQAADETQRTLAIAGAIAARETLAATGRCRLCEEPLTPPARFCGLFCRDRFEAERRVAALFPRVADD